MFKFLIILVMLFSISIVAIYSNNSSGLMEGWIDNNTFQFIATGKSKKGLKSLSSRKATACSAAILIAQVKAIEKLADAGINEVRGTVKITRTRNSVIKEISGFIRGGTVIKKVFNPEKDECTIIYQISSKNLKQKVLRAASKS